LLQCLGVGLAYFTGGLLINLLGFDDASVLIWPSAGLALVAMVVLGFRVWPGIAFGQVLLLWYHGGPLIMLLGLIPGPVLQAWVAARWILRKRGMHPEIRSVRFAVWFVLQIVIVCSLISATFGVAAKQLAGDFNTFNEFFTVWWRWSLGDAVGVIIVYPFLMNWLPHVGARRDHRRTTVQSAVCTVSLVVMSLVIYDAFLVLPPEIKVLPLLPLPVLMWTALRFGMRSATLNMILVATIILWGAAVDSSLILNLSAATRLVVTVGLIFMMGLSTLMAGASAEEHAEDHVALEVSERFSRRILDTTPNIIYVFDLVDQRNIYSNHKIAEFLGYSPSQIHEMGDQFLLRLLHPEDVAQLSTLFARWKTAKDSDLFSTEYRMKGADGSWHWFQATDAVFKRNEDRAVTQIIGNARDITESRHAQEQARIDGAFNQSIVASAGEGICVCAEVMEFPHIRFSVWNGQMYSITGYTMEEINRLGWYQCMYPDPEVQQRAIGRRQRMRTGDNMAAEEWEITRQDGGRRQILITTSIVISADGLPNVLRVMNDITSRNEAATAIKRLEDLYRQAIAAANAVPYMEDHSTNEFSFMGDGIRKLTGYSSAEMNRKIWDEIVVTSVLQGGEPGMEASEAVGLARAGKIDQWQCDMMIRAKDGEHRWLADCAVEIPGANGIPTGSIGILVDITDRKRAEEALRDSEARFRAFLDNSPAAAFMKDKSGRYVVGNRAWARQFREPIEKLLGKTDEELWDAETAALFRKSDLATISAGENISRIERVRRADGTERWLSVLKFPVYRFGGEDLIGGIVIDVTEQKLADDKIQQLNQELEDRVRERTEELNRRVEDVERLNRGMVNLLEDLQSARTASDDNSSKYEVANRQLKAINHELEAFSYSISHDLRAPLRHIHGFVRLLQKETDEKLSETGRHRMEVIAESATRMGRLIDDLLSFSRSGRAELKQSIVDVNKLVRDVIAEFQTETEGRQITWNIAPLPEVLGDQNLLRQVFVNLISNAVKYTSRVPIAVIEIGEEPLPRPTMAGFFIKDNGAGFDMKYVGKLFGVFQRLHRQNEFEGTGIGLANVRRIIHRHGGQIRVEAELDRGATFHFTLPKPIEPGAALESPTEEPTQRKN